VAPCARRRCGLACARDGSRYRCCCGGRGVRRGRSGHEADFLLRRGRPALEGYSVPQSASVADALGREERVGNVVAPLVPDPEVVAQATFATEPEFLDKRREAMLSGWMKAARDAGRARRSRSIAETASAPMPCL
jgi:hypothetical protein